MKISWNTYKTKLALASVVLFSMSSPGWANNGLTFSSFENEAVQRGVIHKVYNQDQFEGNWKQLKGALKENWGEFTDDDLLAIEGRAERFEGKVQERYGERKEEVKEWVDKWLDEHSRDRERATRNP
jgi:uncharacterized protein YjbJ (UPF0337 family)